MYLHVVIQLSSFTPINRTEMLVQSLTAEAVLDGTEEFDTLMPVQNANTWYVMFITAHRCPVVERT